MDNIHILVELLYDLLEYNIVFVFDIIKIAKLLETEGLKVDPTWKGTLHDNMVTQMDSIDYRIKLNRYIKQEMKTIEYECLICIAEFLNEIYPDFEEDSNNFNECLENLCYRLFGFKNDDINNPKDVAKAENILIATRKFMDLFEFIIVLIRNEYPTNDQIFKKTAYSTFSKLGGTTFFSKSTTRFSPIGENEYRQILNASLLNPEKDKLMINKEKFMLNIYQTLGKYFNNNIEGKEYNKQYR